MPRDLRPLLVWMRGELLRTGERLAAEGWREVAHGLWVPPAKGPPLPTLAADDVRRELASTSHAGTTEVEGACKD